MNRISAAAAVAVFLLLTQTIMQHQILAQESDFLAQNALAGEELITKACDHAVYRKLCVSSLKSVPESKDADLFDLTTIALKLAAANATQIKHQIDKMLRKTSDKSSSLYQSILDCSENYHDAIEQIKDSIAALNSNGYDDINTWVTAAMADAESCEVGFTDHPGLESPFTERSTIFSQLCSNVLVITSILAGKI